MVSASFCLVHLCQPDVSAALPQFPTTKQDLHLEDIHVCLPNFFFDSIFFGTLFCTIHFSTLIWLKPLSFMPFQFNTIKTFNL